MQKTAKMKKGRNAEIGVRPTVWRDIVRNKWLVLLCVPAIAFFIIFSYIPMAGAWVAFVDYKAVDGIWAVSYTHLDVYKRQRQ